MINQIKLISHIKDEIENLSKKAYTTNEKAEFLNNFIFANRFNSFQNISAVDLTDFIVAYLSSVIKSSDLHYIKDKIYPNKDLIEDLEVNAFESIISFILLVTPELSRENINIKSISKIKIEYPLIKCDDKGIRKKYKAFIKEHNAFINKSIEQGKILGMIELYYDYPIEFMCAINRARMLKKIKLEREEKIKDAYIEHQKLRMNGEPYVPQKRIEKFIDKKLSLKYSLLKIEQDLSIITKHCNQLLTADKNVQKETRTKIKKYKKFLQLFESEINKEEITKIDDLINLLPDEELTSDVLQIIYNHNKEEYKKLEEEYTRLSDDSKIRFQALLGKYGIDYDEYDASNEQSMEILAEELKILSDMNITNPKLMITIINESGIFMMKYIYDLIQKNIITTEFATNNLAIFNKNVEDSAYPNLASNVTLIESRGINPAVFNTNPEIFLERPKTIIENLDIIHQYNLTKSLKTTSSHQYLHSNSLATKIDNILELGFEKDLVENLDLLNKSDDAWKRVRILKELNIPITTTSELIEILDAKKFMIPDNNLDEYIFNINEYITDKDIPILEGINLQDLEEYSISNYTYNFNGVLISKNKVKRNMTDNSNNILKAIISNSIINDQEYNTIKETLIPKTKTYV